MGGAIGLLDGFFLKKAPAARPAVMRILLGVYVLYYTGVRYQMFINVAGSDPELFKPVGVAKIHEKPVSVKKFRIILFAFYALNVAFILGFRHRRTGPLFAALMLWLLSYRNSWSMIYHSDNILVFHAMILGFSRSADVYSLDSLRRAVADEGEPDWRYGWPMQLMNTATTLTYFLAGFAKAKGPLGWRWGEGESLRGQVAVDGLRKELLGGSAAALAYALYERLYVFKMMGIGSFVVELVAPFTLLDKRLSRLWAMAAFGMHWGILFIMDIKFRYQLAGLIFAPFFDLEKLPKLLVKAFHRLIR
jgi:hypothetical protein